MAAPHCTLSGLFPSHFLIFLLKGLIHVVCVIYCDWFAAILWEHFTYILYCRKYNACLHRRCLFVVLYLVRFLCDKTFYLAMLRQVYSCSVVCALCICLLIIYYDYIFVITYTIRVSIISYPRCGF